MPKKSKNIILDINKQSDEIKFEVFRLDDIELTINLIDGERLYNLEDSGIELIMDVNGKPIQQISNVKIIRNKAIVNINNGAFDTVGKHKGKLKILNGEGIISTPVFYFEVKDSIVDDNVVVNDVGIEVIDKIMDYMELYPDGGANTNHSHENFNTLETITSEDVTKLKKLEGLDDFAKKKDLEGKVDKVIGKGLSDENFTSAEKIKLSGLVNYVHPNDKNTRHITDEERERWNSTIGFSGDYNDLVNKPEIPIIDVNKKYVDDSISGIDNKKVDKVIGKQLTDENFTLAEKNKLNGLSNYTHPSSHDASMIIESVNKRFVSDIEKQNWNNKSNFDGNYNSLTNKPNIPTKTSQLVNDSVFATETFVTNKIKEAELGGGNGEIDLSGYATKEDLNLKADKISIPSKISQLTNDSKFLTSIPTEYITETELNNKGYLTEHQDISGKVDKVIGKSLISDTEIVRLSNVKNYDDTQIKSDMAKKANTTDLHDHSNKSELDKIAIGDKAKWDAKSDFSGSYNDLTNKPTIPDISSYQLQNDNTLTTTSKTVIGAINENKSSLDDITTKVGDETKGLVKDVNDLKNNSIEGHTHTNKTILDNINAEKVSEWSLKASTNYVDEAVRGVTVGTAEVNGLIRNGSSSGHRGYTTKNPIRPCISFSDDDGKIGVYTKWRPILESKNIPISICVITDYVGNSGYMTWEQIRELQNTYGCEILSHTDNHNNFNSRYNSEIIQMLKNTKEVLMKNGLRVNGFAYPNGGFYSKDAGLDVSYLCAKEYEYAVITQNKINTYPISNSMLLDRNAIGCYESAQMSTLDGIKARIDECISNNGWLIFMTHVDDVAHTEEDTTNLGLIIDYIKELGTADIVTIEEGYKRFGNLIESDKGQLTNQGELFGLSGGSYNLPIASATVLGGIKVGSGLSISNGVLSSTGGIDLSNYYIKSEVDYYINQLSNRIAVLEGGTVETYGEIVLSKTSTTIMEGGTDTFTVKLDKAPTNNQVVTLTKSKVNVTLSSETLTFTASNWNIEQTITITASEDDNYDDETCIITFNSPNVLNKTLTVNITNNDIIPPSSSIYNTRYMTSATGCVKIADKTYKLTDDEKWNNVLMMYDSEVVPLGNYNICVEVLERNLTATAIIETPSKWSVTHVSLFTKSDIDLVNCNLNQTYKIPVTIYENEESEFSSIIFGCQFQNTNTKDSITVKIWLEDI